MCTNSRLFKNKNGDLIYSPCKYYCLECRNMRREEFTQRLLNEWKSRSYIGSFITLTYRDDDLPILLPEGSAIVGQWFKNCPPAFGSTLYRPDLSQFADKMQKRLKRAFGQSGKYIMVGEYGDDLHRPHYHGIYIGLPCSERRMLLDCWSHGRVDIAPISHADIRYTLSYIDKQVFGAKQLFEQFGDFEPPFAHFSKGLGVKWIENNLDKFNEFGELEYTDKKKYTLPPYFRDKYGFMKKIKIGYENNLYSDSVKEYAEKYHISDLEEAKNKRDYLSELSLRHKEISRFGTNVDLHKQEILECFRKST